MLHYLNSIFPVRYTALALSGMGLLLSLFTLVGFGVGAQAVLLFAALLGLGVFDVRQTKRSILRNYPINWLRTTFASPLAPTRRNPTRPASSTSRP